MGRMERDGHVLVAADGRDRRSRIVRMTDSGRYVWQVLALPMIHAYYEQILGEFSVNDVTHTLHYLLRCSRTRSGWMSNGTASAMAPRFRYRQPVERRETCARRSQLGRVVDSIQARVSCEDPSATAGERSKPTPSGRTSSAIRCFKAVIQCREFDIDSRAASR
jgi:hypothetical protein